jgi:hypothetical protein
MGATTRLMALSVLLAVMFGLTLSQVQQADAAPFRPRPYSESERTAAKDECQLGGGTQFETRYHYGFGGTTATSATTVCHGGKNDGQTCEISGSRRTCTSAALPTNDPSGVVVVEQIAMR